MDVLLASAEYGVAFGPFDSREIGGKVSFVISSLFTPSIVELNPLTWEATSSSCLLMYPSELMSRACKKSQHTHVIKMGSEVFRLTKNTPNLPSSHKKKMFRHIIKTFLICKLKKVCFYQLKGLKKRAWNIFFITV